MESYRLEHQLQVAKSENHSGTRTLHLSGSFLDRSELTRIVVAFTPRVHNRARFFVALPLIAAATLGFFTSVEAQAPLLPFNFQPNDNLNIRGYIGKAEHGANVWALSAEAKAPAQNDFQMTSSFGWQGVGTHQVGASGDLDAQFPVSDNAGVDVSGGWRASTGARDTAEAYGRVAGQAGFPVGDNARVDTHASFRASINARDATEGVVGVIGRATGALGDKGKLSAYAGLEASTLHGVKQVAGVSAERQLGETAKLALGADVQKINEKVEPRVRLTLKVDL